VIGQFEGLSLEEIRKVIPDKEAAKAILAAANNMDVFRENTEAMVNVAGLTQEAYAEMSDTVAFKFGLAAAALEVLQTTFGAFLADGRSGIDVIGGFTGVLNSWSGLLSLNEQGVSRLRTEWQMFIDSPLVAVKSVIIENVDTAVEKANQAVIDGFVESNIVATEVNGQIVRTVKEGVSDAQRSYLEGEIKKQEATESFLKSVEDGHSTTGGNVGKILDNTTKDVGEAINIQTKAIADGLTEQEKNWLKAETTRRALSGDTNAELISGTESTSSEVVSIFGTTIDSMGNAVNATAPGLFSSIPPAMGDAAGEATGIFDGFIGDISGEVVDVGTNTETATAFFQFQNLISRISNRSVIIRANVVGGTGAATGGFVTASGVIGFAGGGIAPSDTVPAMLTPGEFVINRRQTQRNFGLLKAINSGVAGFARGGLVGFQEGGGVLAGAVGVGAQRQGGGGALTGGGGLLAGLATEEFTRQQEAQAEANEARMEAQLEANEQFLDMMADFQQGITDIQLDKMDEREQLFFERQKTLSDILQGPFSEEQKELMVENANAFFDAQLGVIEEKEAGEIAAREAEILEERLAKIQEFQQSAGKAFGKFFADQIKGQKSFNQASQSLFNEGAGMIIDAIVKQKTDEILATQTAEVGKALLESPGTFGASLAKIPLILAAGAAAKAAIGQIKFHEGGIVGGDINAPPRDVPIIAQAGERVLSREETQAIEAGAGGGGSQEIVIPVNIDGQEVARAIARIGPQPNREFT
jgi:hypothetical protein